jgi:hypothetical protein
MTARPGVPPPGPGVSPPRPAFFPPNVPPYGSRSLAEVVPSILSAVGLEGFPDLLGIEHTDRACLVVIDALGWEVVRDHASAAPFLATLLEGSDPISAGFPATTVTSLASLATGLPPGEHGLMGDSFAVPGHERPMNALRWELYGIGPHVDLSEELPPEAIQALPTLLQRAAEAGLEPTVVGPLEHAGTPLTRAILRGGRYVGTAGEDQLVEFVADALSASSRAVVYAYHPWLDPAGHLYGVGSERWLEQLAAVDGIVRGVADRAPAGSALFVTADHGMVNLEPEDRLDVDDEPSLMGSVRFLAGEARARHAYVRDAAADDVIAAWRHTVGDRMVVLSRDEAIERGWFGPRVNERFRQRIGDVVAAAVGQIGIVQRGVDPLQASFTGHHGSMTEAERLVPLFEVRT